MHRTERNRAQGSWMPKEECWTTRKSCDNKEAQDPISVVCQAVVNSFPFLIYVRKSSTGAALCWGCCEAGRLKWKGDVSHPELPCAEKSHRAKLEREETNSMYGPGTLSNAVGGDSRHFLESVKRCHKGAGWLWNVQAALPKSFINLHGFLRQLQEA